MTNRTENQVNTMLRTIKRRRWYAALLVCLALMVTAGVAGVFHLPAIAKTYQVTELTCTAVPPEGAACADFFVHIHNDVDCFDAEGKLVCPLPEIKPHRHTADCFVTTRTLVCTTPESDGHQHTADCYTRVRGDLICELSTEPVLDEEGNVLEEGHVHTDECFAWTEELSCGMEEGQGAHHHDDSCYETITTLNCDEPEVFLHTHTDACYQKNEDGSIYVDEDGNTWLICGQLQVLEHVHGPECFTTYERDNGEPEVIFPEEEEQPAEKNNLETQTGDDVVTDNGVTESVDDNTSDTEEGGDAEGGKNSEVTDSGKSTQADKSAADADNAKDSENTESTDDTESNADGEKQEAVSGETAPAGEEPHTVVYTGTRGAEMRGITVLAEIPEGALDENAQLILSDADESAARKQILKVLNEYAAEGEEREISSILLLDIGFVSGGEPATLNGLDPIRVTLRAAAIRGMNTPRLFHLTGGTAREVEDVIFDTQAGSAVFTGTTFSPFAIVELTGEETAKEKVEETVSVSMPAQDFHAATDEVEVFVTAPEGAFPVGTTMYVSTVPQEEVIGALNDAANGVMVRNVQAVDITFRNAADEEIEPLLPISVRMSRIAKEQPIATEAAPEAKESVVLHVENDGSAQIVENANVTDTEAEFESDSFSTYIMADFLTEEFLASNGHNYRISVTYGAAAGIPENADLNVEELTEGSSAYETYVANTESALGMEEGSAGYIRLFDISIVDKHDPSVRYQPAAGTSVDVKIELADSSSESLNVVHFADENSAGDIVTAETDGQNVSFAAEGFSVYAIVDGDQSTGETYSIKYTFVLDDGQDTPFYFTNKNGDETNIQYVKNGEIPLNPGTPTVSSGEQEDKEFAGWWTKNGDAWGTELSFDKPVSTSSLQEITVYARYDNTQYVTYYDENGTVYLVDRRHENDTVLTTDVNPETREKWTEQELEEYRFVSYQPVSKTTAFLGWTATRGKPTPDDNFIITEATTLYPVIAEVKWVTYHSGPTGSNATYFGAEYALDGNWNRTSLADHVPTRAGYWFDGWYIRNTATQGDNDHLDYSWTVVSSDVRVTDANGNFDNSFKNNSTYFENGKLKNDIELVAHWTPTTVNYVFVYYQQKPNANDDGTYDYVYKDSRTASGIAGTNTGTPPVPDWDDIAGFTLHQTSDSSDPYNVKTEVIEGNESTVVNVYYDRNEYIIQFKEISYNQTQSTNGVLYGRVNNQYVRIIRKSNNNDYYAYIPTAGNYGTQFGYVNGNYVQLTSYYGDWIYQYGSNWYYYVGERYTRQDYYRYNPRYVQTWVTIDELTIEAKYGEDVSQLWPDKRTGLSTDYPQQWYTTTDGSVMQSGIQTMPPNNQVFYNRENSGVENHLVYWLQNLPSENGGTAPNSFTSVRNDLIYGNSLSTTWDDYSIYEGFKVNIGTQDAATLNDNNGAEVATTNNNYSISAQIGASFSDDANNTLNFYYLRNKYSITFQQDNTVVGSDEYYYEADISGADKYSSAVTVPAGMRFVGWYDNPEGIGDAYTFDGQTMPPNNLILYAKLVPEEYYVRLDYNGGETKGSESTFAWVDYGETIEEAEDVKRNYVAVSEGETGTHNYVYWRYDEAADAAGEGWWSYYEDADGNIIYNEPKDYSKRTATYVEAAGGQYKYDPSKYTFIGWYETDQDGNQISNVPFNFATQITKDTYLKAIFRKEGTFQVRYLHNMGTEGTEAYVAGNPNTAPPTDSYTYIDLSEAKVGHSIEPADGKHQFAGWRVKGTSGPIYQPGETFPINSDYAEEEGGIQYITLEPVFIQKGDTKISYQINTPSGRTASETALTDLTDNTQDKLILDGAVTLHSGDGFAVPGYKLIGWSDKPIDSSANPIHLKADGTYEGSIPADTHIFKLGGKYGVSDEEGNTLYAVWESKRIEFTKSVAVDGTLTTDQVDHTIYIALTKGDKETYVRDQNGDILVKEIRIVNGVPTPATVVFDGLEDGSYNVWELKDPSGSRLGVSDVFPIDGGSGNFAVKKISGNNNATLSEDHLTAETALTNTYAKEDETPIKFEAKKVWIDRKANEIPDTDLPENATATFTLYQKIDGGQPEVVRDKSGDPVTVTLDGHVDETADCMEDEPWHASFGNLRRSDDQGHRITYMVKETAATPDGYYPWKEKSQNNDQYGPNDYLEHSDGVIYNRKLTMSIRLDKHFDFQPNNGDEQTVTYEYFKTDKATQEKLLFTVTLPTGEVKEFKLSDFDPVMGDTTFSLTLENIPYFTGLYAPEGYKGSTITFQESGEFELLEAYNYYLVNITPDNGTEWNIGSEKPTAVTATQTQQWNINADDPTKEIRIQNKYRRGAEGKFVKLTKTVTGLTEEDFNENSEMLKNLHFVIRNKAGYYAGLNPNPAFNPETMRYEKLTWVQNISDAQIISPVFNYNHNNGKWEAEFNLSGFENFPSGEYTIVELEAQEGGYDGKSAQIEGYVLTVKDYTFNVETHGNDTAEWNDAYDYTLHVTNEYKPRVGTVEFIKKASDQEEPDNLLPGATFTLFTDSICTTTAKNADSKDAVATSSEEAESKGKVSFTNIPVGTYYMKETAAPEGYQVSPTVYQVVIAENAENSTIKVFENNAASGENLTEIINEPDKIKIKLLKTSMSNTPLSGATFTLLNQDKTGSVNEIDHKLSDSSGNIDLGELQSGIYWLRENDPPNGYIGLTEDIQIEVKGSERKGYQVVAAVYEHSAVSYQEEEGIYVITIPNNPGVELPSTGGPGTGLFTAIGGIVTALAGAVLALKRRKVQA